MQNQIKDLYKPLFLFIKKRVNSFEDAEDLTQEVFLKLSKSNIDAVKNIKSWVYTIAKNTITDYYRSNKRRTEEVSESLFFEGEEKENAVEELSNCCITPFIKQLPKEYHTIIQLSEIEGVSQKEIAAKLDMNYVTVRSKVQRGRKKLKDLFTECCTIIQGGKGSILEFENKNTNCKRDCE